MSISLLLKSCFVVPLHQFPSPAHKLKSADCCGSAQEEKKHFCWIFSSLYLPSIYITEEPS